MMILWYFRFRIWISARPKLTNLSWFGPIWRNIILRKINSILKNVDSYFSILDNSKNFGKYFGKLVKFRSKFWSKLWEKGVIMTVFLGSSTLFLCILSLKIATAQKLCNFLVAKSRLRIWGSASIEMDDGTRVWRWWS